MLGAREPNPKPSDAMGRIRRRSGRGSSSLSVDMSEDRFGMLALASSSRFLVGRRLRLSNTARVLEKSCLRLGLIGGKGGADRLLLRDMFCWASGRDVVGNRELDVTNVGSEMSFVLILRLLPSADGPLLAAWLGGSPERGEEGSVADDGPRAPYGEGMGETGEG